MKRWMTAILAVAALSVFTACGGFSFTLGNPDADMGVGNFSSGTGTVDLSFWARSGAVGGVVTEIRFLVNGATTLRTAGTRFGPGCVPEGVPKVGEEYVCAKLNPTGTTGLHNATPAPGQRATTTFTFGGGFTSLVVESFTVKGDSGVARTFVVNTPVAAP